LWLKSFAISIFIGVGSKKLYLILTFLTAGMDPIRAEEQNRTLEHLICVQMIPFEGGML